MHQETSALTMRLAEAEDWPLVAALYQADGYRRAAARVRQLLPAELEQFQHGQRLLWLVERDGQAVGTVGLVFSGMDAGTADGVSSANIHRLQVLVAERRRGVATALMAAAEDEARRRRFGKLTVDVEEDNQPALALYEKLGFRHVGWGQGPKEITYEKALS